MPVILPNGQPLRGPQTPAELDLARYFGLAKSRAKRWHHWLAADEAFAVALLGLVKARDAWQPSRGPFGSIVIYYVDDALKEAVQVAQRQAGMAPADRVGGHYRPPTASRLQAVKVVSASQLDANGNKTELWDGVAGTELTPEQALLAKDAGAALRAALAQLPPREERLLRLLYFGDNGECSHEDVAAVQGVSRERIRQIHVRALTRLRRLLAGLGLGEDHDAATAPRPRPPRKPSAARQRAKGLRPVAWSRNRAGGKWRVTGWG